MGPEVTIGRSPDCHLTLEDPLVSRRHARIELREEDAALVDLGSRNGVHVNGERVEGTRPLTNGDRIRLGTQELVFYAVDGAAEKAPRTARSTGFMLVCPACDRPYPEDSPACPHCGAAKPDSEDTITGLSVEHRRTWTFQLLGEVIERALRDGRIRDAERIMRRAAHEVDDRQQSGELLPIDQLTTASDFALRLAEQGGREEWIHWVLNAHRDHGYFPREVLLDHLERLDFADKPDASAALDDFREWAASRRESFRPPPPADEIERLQRLTSA